MQIDHQSHELGSSSCFTYGVILDVGIFDYLGANFGSGEVILTGSIAEVVRAFMSSVKLR